MYTHMLEKNTDSEKVPVCDCEVIIFYSLCLIIAWIVVKWLKHMLLLLTQKLIRNVADCCRQLMIRDVRSRLHLSDWEGLSFHL